MTEVPNLELMNYKLPKAGFSFFLVLVFLAKETLTFVSNIMDMLACLLHRV